MSKHSLFGLFWPRGICLFPLLLLLLLLLAKTASFAGFQE